VAVPALLKYIWTSPGTLLGAVVVLCLLPLGARAAVRKGVIEVTLRQSKRRASWGSLPFAAVTLGHVVVAATAQDQARLRAHERVHVAQFERWGPLFLLAYPAESALQLLIGRRPYLDNRFEVEARRLAADQPTRRWPQ